MEKATMIDFFLTSLEYQKQIHSEESYLLSSNKKCSNCRDWIGPTFQKPDGLCINCRKVN